MKSKFATFTLLISFVTAGCISASGNVISPENALARLKRDAPARIAAKNINSFQLVYTAYDESTESPEASPTIYVFNQGSDDGLRSAKRSGFVILSADDATAPVLGYSDGDLFSAETSLENENLKYWLDVMSRRIAYVRNNAGAAIENPGRVYPKNFKPMAHVSGEAIEPLCKTRWNQDAPYYDKCPMSGDKHTYTGCVATSMAQVMKYHNWPDKGEGENSYTWNGKSLKEVFYTKTYDWDNMLDVYRKGNYTETEGDAVATLMRSCGISVNMSYSTSGSGAASVYIAKALGTYFKYDKSVRFMKREYYSLAEWEETIYNSLKNDGPVIYDGQSLIGGHSFVCDGYDGNGYFHFNWGWSGASDGYFLLDVLEPAIQGIGGSQSGTGFDFSQDIIVGIRPDKNGTSEEWTNSLYAMSYPDIDTDETYSKGEDFAADGYVFNGGPGLVPQGGQLGVAYTPAAGGEPIYAGYEIERDVEIGYGFSQYPVMIPEDLPAGEYTMDFVYCGLDGKWMPVRIPLYDPQAYKVSVSGNSVTFIAEDPIELVAEYEEVSEFHTEGEFTVKANVTNPADRPYYGQILGVLLDSKHNLLATSNEMTVDFEAGETHEVSYTSEFTQFADNFSIAPGDYLFCLGTSASRYILTISELVKIHISEGSGIVEIEKIPADAKIYNLNGIPAEHQKKGEVYILPGIGKVIL